MQKAQNTIILTLKLFYDIHHFYKNGILPEPSLNNEINRTSVNKYPWLKL